MTGIDRPPTRRISWNGFGCSIPADWETVVKGPAHLIFEDRLQPALELRWELVKSRNSPEKRVKTIFSRLQRESGGALLQLNRPEITEALTEGFVFMAYGRSATRLDGLIAACNQCATPLLMRFFETGTTTRLPPKTFFQSLSCTNCLAGERNWSIQDISFTVPDAYTLDAFSFGFGLSRISFSAPDQRLEYCRLAPASEHLRQASLPELFSAFCDSPPERQTAASAYELAAQTRPEKLTERLRNRLKRSLGYQLARFHHLPEADRILGTRLAGRRQPDRELFERLCANHVLVQ